MLLLLKTFLIYAIACLIFVAIITYKIMRVSKHIKKEKYNKHVKYINSSKCVREINK